MNSITVLLERLYARFVSARSIYFVLRPFTNPKICLKVRRTPFSFNAPQICICIFWLKLKNPRPLSHPYYTYRFPTFGYRKSCFLKLSEFWQQVVQHTRFRWQPLAYRQEQQKAPRISIGLFFELPSDPT